MNTNKSKLHEAASEIRTLRSRLDSLADRVKHYIEQQRQQELIKREEAAELIDVHPRTVGRMAERGEIYKYNPDGTRKETSVNTTVFYDKNEVLKASN